MILRAAPIFFLFCILISPRAASAADFYNVNNSANITITEHNQCRDVTNNHASGLAIFVPTKTATEWASFYDNPPAGVAVSMCPPRYVFVTSTTYQGDFGAVFVADGHCNTRAAAASLPGTYKAWIAGSNGTAPASRFIKGYPYVLPDDTTTIADDWDDLTDGSLDNGIEQDEFGNVLGMATNVWSAVNPDGTWNSTNHCLSWTSNQATDWSRYGTTHTTTGAWTFSAGGRNCASTLPLYCFQQ